MAGIFGGLAKKQSLFNQMPGMNPSTDPMTQGGFGAPGQMTQQMPQTPAKTGTNWAGILADFLSGASGGTPMFAQQQYANRQDDRQQQQRQQQQEQQRQASRSDWLWQQQWKKDNPDPVNPQYFDDNAGNRYSFDPVTGQKKTIFIDPNDKQFIQDGQLITVPNVLRSQSAAAPPQAHIDALLTNPDKAADFDAKYGPGASTRYLQGGQASPTPATFPPR